MRIFICCALFFICVVIIPTAECDRKYNRVSDYNERDRRETRERYSRRNNGYDDEDYRPKRRHRGSDEDLSSSKPEMVRRERQRREENNGGARTRGYKEKVIRRKFEDTEEDYTDEHLSNACVDKRGRRCESDESVDEEDYTDEETDERQGKKRVIYVKKFPHEKRKKNSDNEAGNILKIHRKAKDFSRSDDDDASEEMGVPKRRRYIFEDEEE